MKTWRIIQGIFWIFLYLLITLIPLYVMLAEPLPAGREWWREFSVALGFCGLAMIALQFALTARFKVVKAPFGSDIVYFFHKQISIAAFLMVLAHPIILFVFSPDLLNLLNVVTAPWRARAALASLLGLAGLIIISVWRKRLRIEYNRWRIWHGILATAAVALALVHITLVNHYLDSPWKKLLWGVYGLFFLGLLFYTRVLKPFILMRRPYEVVSISPEAGDAWRLTLRPVGHGGMKFMPGQFAWLTAWKTPFADAEHPFSISSSANRRDEIEFTIKELGDFTGTIKQMQPGQRVYLDGAYGSFSVDRHPHAASFAFIAGGIGITPFMSMLRTLADRGERRPLVLLYANRNIEAASFRQEIESLKSRLNLKVVDVIERPPEGWQGESGFINAAILDRHLPTDRRPNQLEVFVCGPQPMMDAVEKALGNLGLSPGDVHSERFDLV